MPQYAKTLKDFKKIVMNELVNNQILSVRSMNKVIQSPGQTQTTNWVLSENSHKRNFDVEVDYCFLISLSKYSTWNDYKISALKPKYPYVELRIGWVEKTGEIYYEYSSWAFDYYLPNKSYPYNGGPRIVERTEDEIRGMPSVWSNTFDNTKLAHFTPWPLCNYDCMVCLQGQNWKFKGTKIFTDIQDVVKIFQFEKDEIKRCLPIVDKMENDYKQIFNTYKWEDKKTKQIIIDFKRKMNTQNVNEALINMDF